MIGFEQDVQALSQLAEKVARLAPTGEFHLLEGMSHGSLWGHRQDEGNRVSKGITDRHLA